MSTNNRDQALKHKAAFRQRRKSGLQPVAKPWDWLSIAEVQKMAVEAYRVASFGSLLDLEESSVSAQELREVFAANLVDMFRDLAFADAVTRGGCWPVDASTPPYRNYPQIAAALCEDVPLEWRPQYPVYNEVTPASVCTTPEVVINADEGNANDHHFRP